MPCAPAEAAAIDVGRQTAQEHTTQIPGSRCSAREAGASAEYPVACCRADFMESIGCVLRVLHQNRCRQGGWPEIDFERRRCSLADIVSSVDILGADSGHLELKRSMRPLAMWTVHLTWRQMP